MKRTLLFGPVLAALAVAGFAWFQNGRPTPESASVDHEDLAFQSAKEKLAQLTELNGQPVTTVETNGQTVKAMAGQLLVRTENPIALQAAGSIEETGLPSIYKLNLPTEANLNAEADRVKQIAGVSQANPNYIVSATATPNDPLYGSQWAPPKMGLPSSWDRSTGSESIMIANLDTGVNWNHQDLAGRNWTNSGEVPNNNIDDDNNGYTDDSNGMDFVNATFTGGKWRNDTNGPMDDHGHGSLTTGVHSANTNNSVGVAGGTWTGKYVPIKVLGSSGFGTFEDVALGIQYAQAVGAKVMNLSLGAFGVTGDTATDLAIDNATAGGIVIAAASGNDGSSSIIDYPAYNSKTIAVGSTTSSDARSGFSNGGSGLDIVAPGSGILTVQGYSGGAPVNNQYASFSGTSLSTPQVSAAAALLLSLSPNITATTAIDTLKNSAEKVPGMGGQNWTNLYGFGRLNVERAFSQLPNYSSQWMGQSAYPTVGSGEETTVYMDFKNTGSSAWTNSGPNPVRLGTSHPKDRQSPFYNTSWISPSRAAPISGQVNAGTLDADDASIEPGETARFQFKVTAPPVDSPSLLQEHFQLVAEGNAWMPDQGTFLYFTVQPRTYSYQWAGQSYPPSTLMQPGTTQTVTLDLLNTGTAKWRNDTLYDLNVGTTRPRDRVSAWSNGTWQSPTRISKFSGTVSGGVVTPSSVVNPGETARFSFELKAPATGGNYVEYFEPLVERFRWLGDIGIHWTENVPGQDYAYQWVTQSAYPSMLQGESKTVTVRLRNVGKQTWQSNGPTPVKLGTERPRDRQSGFSNNGNGSGWLSTTRVKLTRNITDPAKDVGGETSIAPGEVAEFEFTATGLPQPGAYNEYFAPVVEGVQWMQDIGMFWRMSVEHPIEVGLAQQATVTATSDGPVRFLDNTGSVMATVPNGQAATLTWNGSKYFGIWPGGSVNSSEPITAAQESIHNVFSVQNMGDNGSFNRFRGNLVIKNGAPGSWLVNQINLEEYLRGLGEVPDGWPTQAIRAQVVAARTYAARRIANPQNSLFDIYDTTQDQVYNGFNNEIAKPNHVVAITATKGKVIEKGGQLIQAFYSSDSGGATGNNEDIWGGSPIDYLRGKADPYERPDIWSKTVANSTIQSNYGHPGNVDAINITEWYGLGRPRTIQLVTNGGAVTNHTLPADTHRTRLTTKSSRITGLSRNGNDWVISGRGFGHGIGLAQWGAFNQANVGRGYDEILRFYYTGVDIVDLY